MINVQSRSIKTDFIFWGYQRVEWIGSSGTQWIDTWITPTQNTKSQMKVSFDEYTWDVVYWYSQWNDDNDYRLFNAYATLSHELFDLWRTTFDFKNQRATWNVWYFQLNTIYELELWNYYLKNIATWTNLVSWSAISSFTWSRTITLNNYNNTYFSKNKWYYVKIYNNWTLIRDFYPVYRKSDNVIWLLDTVNKVFYTNQWTWSFTKGWNIN